MERSNGARLFLFLTGVVAILGAATLAKGGLFINRHEGDTLHLTEILLRMGQGQWPHLDFVTPLGFAGFLPMASFVKAGFGIGTSILMAQVAVAVALIPAIWWVARTRFAHPWGMVFGACVLVMVMAMIHGETSPSISMSMHYNRWAWAAAFLAVPLAMLPARSKGAVVVDGAIIGGAMAFFLLGKVTFGLALAPGLFLGLALRRAWSTLGVALFALLLAVLGVTASLGMEFWAAYIGDLMQVKGSGIRPRAGVDFQTLLLAPRFLVGNLVLVAAIVLLRKSKTPDLGLVLVALMPGFLYITYQNYGNDPKWLALLALLMVATGSTVQARVVGLAAATLIAPSFLNMAVSPARHLMLNKEAYVAVLPDAPHTDLHAPNFRVNQVRERRHVVFSDPQFAALNELSSHKQDVSFEGITYAPCVQQLGLFGVYRDIGKDLRAFGLPGQARIFTTDTFNAIWMFGGFTPLQGGSPWYYGDLSGIEDAQYLLVPSCAVSPHTFEAMIEDLNGKEGVTFKELRRTELYTLYEKQSPQDQYPLAAITR